MDSELTTNKYINSNPDRTSLHKDLYSHYYWLMDTVLQSFITQLKSKLIKENTWEQEVIIRYAQQLKNTLHILRVKYAFEEDQALQIDSTESGYPSSVEITKLEQDILDRFEHLKKLPTEKGIKEEILTHLFKNKQRPDKIDKNT